MSKSENANRLKLSNTIEYTALYRMINDAIVKDTGYTLKVFFEHGYLSLWGIDSSF